MDWSRALFLRQVFTWQISTNPLDAACDFSSCWKYQQNWHDCKAREIKVHGVHYSRPGHGDRWNHDWLQRLCIFQNVQPSKTNQVGLRVYTLADSATGYNVTFEPYYGEKTTESLWREDLPFTSRIVMHLVSALLENITGAGYHLYTDRYYTSYVLAT